MVQATYLSSPLYKQSGNVYEHTDKHDFRHRKGNVESNRAIWSCELVVWYISVCHNVGYWAHPFKSRYLPACLNITLQECQKLSRSGMH